MVDKDEDREVDEDEDREVDEDEDIMLQCQLLH